MADKIEEKLDSGNWDDNKLVSLSDAAAKLGFTPEYLNMLCRQKRMKGKKLGRNWFTTKEWADEYFNDKSRIAKKERSVWVNIVNDDPDEKPKIPLMTSLMIEDGEIGADHQSEIPVISLSEAVDLKNDEIKKKKKFSTSTSFLIFIGAATFIISMIIGDSYLHFIGSQNELDDIYGTEILESEGFVKGEETEETSESKIAFASESFQASEINIGGDVIIDDNEENNPLRIYDLESESYTTKNDGDFRLLVRWKTNKLSKSEIDYAKQNSEEMKNIAEEDYGYNHMAVLSKLEYSSAYIYKIKSRDKWGNEMESDDFGFYTGSKEISVFEMISEAISEVFGWAIKEK